MDNHLFKEFQKKFAAKTELERTVSVGFQGPPELKLEEKLHHLGEFRERVLIMLTKGQVMKKSVYEQIIEALRDKRASKMLIHGDISYRFRVKYQQAAIREGKPYTVIHDPQLKGDAGLIITSNEAVDIENVSIED